MDGKFLKMKLQIMFGSICAIIISLIFIPMMQNNKYEKLSRNCYHSYHIKTIYSHFEVVLERLDNYPTIIPLFLWLGLIPIILDHYYVSSHKSINYTWFRNRHGKRANSFGGWLISIGSCLGTISLIILAIIAQQLIPDNSSMKLTYGFYFLLIAYIINLILGKPAILITIKSNDIFEKKQYLILEFENNNEKKYFKLNINGLFHCISPFRKIIES